MRRRRRAAEAQEAAVADGSSHQVAEAKRVAWQRDALLRGAEVALLGEAMPGPPAARGAPDALGGSRTVPDLSGRARRTRRGSAFRRQSRRGDGTRDPRPPAAGGGCRCAGADPAHRTGARADVAGDPTWAACGTRARPHRMARQAGRRARGRGADAPRSSSVSRLARRSTPTRCQACHQADGRGQPKWRRRWWVRLHVHRPAVAARADPAERQGGAGRPDAAIRRPCSPTNRWPPCSPISVAPGEHRRRRSTPPLVKRRARRRGGPHPSVDRCGPRRHSGGAVIERVAERAADAPRRIEPAPGTRSSRGPLVRPRRRVPRLAVRHDGPAAVHAGAPSRRRRAARASAAWRRHPSVVAEYAGYATMIFMIGWAAGGLFFGMLGDRIGRVKTMILTILALLALHGAERVFRRHLGFRVLPVPDRPRRRRPVRRRRGARGRNVARPRAAVRARLAAGGLDLGQHAGGASIGIGLGALEAVGRDRQRLARDVRHRRAAGAAGVPIFGRLQGAGALAACGAGRRAARVGGGAVLRSALAAPCHRRRAARVRRRRRPLGHRLLRRRSVPRGARPHRHDRGPEDAVDGHDLAAAEPRRVRRHLRVHPPDAPRRPAQGVRGRLRRGDAGDGVHLLEPERLQRHLLDDPDHGLLPAGAVRRLRHLSPGAVSRRGCAAPAHRSATTSAASSRRSDRWRSDC